MVGLLLVLLPPLPSLNIMCLSTSIRLEMAEVEVAIGMDELNAADAGEIRFVTVVSEWGKHFLEIDGVGACMTSGGS